MKFRVDVIRDFEALRASRHSWNELAGNFPFFRWEWMANWQMLFAKDALPLIVVVKDEADNWIGIAPFCITESAGNGKSLELLSSGMTCGDYLDLICDPQDYLNVASHLVDWLSENTGAESEFGGFDSIILEGVSGDCPQMKQLQKLFADANYTSHVSEIESCWEVDLPAEWDELNASFSKSLRRKTKKAVQRLADPNTVVRSSRELGLEALWATFVELHQLRRESLGEPGCFANSNFDLFLKTAVQQLSGLGRAEVVVFEYEGVPFCGQLLLNDGERSFMYQSGIHPDWVKHEPGYQMIVWALKESISRGYRSYDFLRGDEPYKARWKTVRKPLSRIKLVAPKLGSRLRHQVWLSGKSIKGYLGQIGLMNN